MAQLSIEIDGSARYFVTREKGELAYGRIRERLVALPEGHALVLDFPEDQLMDVSFADETIIRLGQEILAAKFGQRCLLLKGLSADSVKNIEAALRLQRLKLAFLHIGQDRSWQIVGPLERSLKETLQIVDQHAHITAPELATMLDLAVNTASNRLKRLSDQHLIRREFEVSEKGLQYIYYFWQWTDQPPGTN